MSKAKLDASEINTIKSYNLEAEMHFREQVIPKPSEDLIKARKLMVPDPLLLDIGCGCGRFIPSLHQLDITRYIGIDPSDGMLTIARKEYPGVDFRSGNVYDLPEIFPTDQFDTILAIITLTHIPSVKMCTALNAIHKVSRRGTIGFMSFVEGTGVTRMANGKPRDKSYAGPVASVTGWTIERVCPVLERSGFSPQFIHRYKNGLYSVTVKVV